MSELRELTPFYLKIQLPEHQVDAPVHGDLFIEMIV